MAFCLVMVLSASAQDSSLKSWNYSLQLKSPGFEVRYVQKEDERNTGAAFYTDSFWKYFPCQVKLGKTSAGGSWSFLKSPELNFSYTPFGSVKTGAQGVTGALCGTNSFPESDSCYLQVGYVNGKFWLNKFLVNSWYNPEDEILTGSCLLQISLLKKLKLSYSYTAGQTVYDDNSFSSWFNNGAGFFHSGKMLSMGHMVSLVSPNFKLLFLNASYTSPSGRLQTIYRSENKLTAGRFVFTFSGFYNPWDNLYLPKDSFIDSQLSLKSGMNYTFRFMTLRPQLLKAGGNVYCKINLSDTSHPLKAAAGFQLNNHLSSFSLYSITSMEIHSDMEPYQVTFSAQKISTSCNWYLSFITLGISGDWTYTPVITGNVFNHKYGTTFSTGKQWKLSGGASWNQNFKSGEITSNKINCNLSAQAKMGWVVINGRVAFEFDL